MRIAYFDCSTGIAGDMTLAALIDAGVDAEAVKTGIASLGIPGVELVVRPAMRGGFRATQVEVKHPEQHAHRHLSDIHALIDSASAVTDDQKQIARTIFEAIATAEAHVHGTTIDKIHFHEVGAIDSIVDIVGVAIAFDLLNVDLVVCSAIPTGRGKVKIDHGVCAVPTPGTAELLKGMPLADVPVELELTTPTGAAIAATLVDEFGELPAMRIDAIGYGAGTRDIPGRANVLRILVGESVESPHADRIVLLETNLDDVSPEVVGYAKRKLFEAGALDVYTTPIQMKKDRPGTLLSVIAAPCDVTKLEAILFQETETFGVRRVAMERSIRARREYSVQTGYGVIRGKLGWRPGEAAVFTPEFEDCARVAEASHVPLREVYRAAEASFAFSFGDGEEGCDHDHDGDHDCGHDHDAEMEQDVEPPAHEHSHDHGHDHSHDHRHDHRHDHSHDHGHDHDGHRHG